MRKKKFKESLAGYLYITPATILMIVLVVLPIFMSVYLSLTKFNGFKTPEYIGIKNYTDMFKDPEWRASMKNTLVYVLITVPIQTFLSLFFATILASYFRGRFGNIVRGVMFIPVLCSATVAGQIFYYLFGSDSESMMNLLMALFGHAKVNWLGQSSTALPVICAVAIWKNVGYYLVIFYAGIMDVPNSLLEAARVDGATPVQEFLHIIIPSIKPILYLVVTLSTIWAFQAFDIIYVMTRGGPGNATQTPVLIVYNSAFATRRMGYACAVACILGVLILIVTIIQRKAFSEKAGGEDG